MLMSSNSNPKLSVIIPCYNKVSYLIDMISCIINQTFQNWELILVDDGSKKDCFQEVHDFVSKDSRILHIRRDREPKNGDTCRNIGMDLAKGKYIIIFDADDLISETCFEERIKFMDDHPDCDYATFPFASFEEGAAVPSKKTKDRMGNNNKTILQELLTSNYPFTVWANIYRADSLSNLRWDERIFVYQDFDFMVQCELAGLKHLYSTAPYSDYFYRHFVSGNSVCNNFSQEKIDSTNLLFKKILHLIEKREDKQVLLNNFKFFILKHFERLLSINNEQYLDEYVVFVKEYYPAEAASFNKIRNKVNGRVEGHFNQARINFLLFCSFGQKINWLFFTHEFAKWLLRLN